MARPMAVPGIWGKADRLMPMALAVVAVSPKVATSPWVISRPIWNMPFSKPVGTPNFRIFLIIAGWKSSLNTVSSRMIWGGSSAGR